jgi:GNAT superfamily N-acetyltransferase
MISIRKATKADLQTIISLDTLLFKDNYQYDHDLVMNWPESKPGIKYFSSFLNKPHSICFLAEDSGRAIGYILIAPKPKDWKKYSYCEVGNIFVEASYQSKGIGSLLMKKGTAWAKAKGYEKIYVNSYFNNKGAISFYEKHGFSPIDVGLEMSL